MTRSASRSAPSFPPSSFWALLSVLAVAGAFVFAGSVVDFACAARPAGICHGADNRFALMTVLRALVGVPIVAAWWRPVVPGTARPRAVARWAVLVLSLWTIAAVASSRLDAAFVVEVVRTSQPWVLVVAVVLAAPVFEEIVFRGYLLDWSRRWSSWGGVLVTSTAWTLVHGQYEPASMVVLFAMGVSLAAVRVVTGSVVVPIFMHGWWNAVVLLAAGLGT